MLHYNKYNKMYGTNMNIFQKYERKMLDYIKTELNIEIDQFSLYFIEGTRYNFDFVIGNSFYNYFHDFISVDNYNNYTDDFTIFDADGLEPDEFFNFCMKQNLSILLLKDNTSKLRTKSKELIDECMAEIKVLLAENS